MRLKGEKTMTEKYIPKVGDKGFLWENKLRGKWEKEGEVVIVTNKQVGFLDSDGCIHTLSKGHNFKPLTTQDEQELEDLTRLIASSYNENTGSAACAKAIQKYYADKQPEQIEFDDLALFLMEWHLNLKNYEDVDDVVYIFLKQEGNPLAKFVKGIPE